MSPIDESHFKEVAGHFATGVAVVTGSTGDGPAGFTCQSFSSLSLEPFIVSFAASETSTSWPLLREAKFLGINVLSEEQEAVARTFATTGVDKFGSFGWSEGPNGAPLLKGALAHFEGHMLNRATHGDHEFVTLAVDYVASHPGKPLLYYRGGYGLLA